MHKRRSFSLCLAGFSVGGDTLNGGIPTLAIARPMPSRYQAWYKKGVYLVYIPKIIMHDGIIVRG